MIVKMIDEPLARFIKNKREKNQINKIRNEKGEVTIENAEIKSITRDYYEQLYDNKMDKMQESINKDLEELKHKHLETNNAITEIKNTLEGINSRIYETEERISGLEGKMVKITSEEQKKK